MTVMEEQYKSPISKLGHLAGSAVRDLSKELMSPLSPIDEQFRYTTETKQVQRKPDYSRRRFVIGGLVLAGLVAEEYFIGIGRKSLFSSTPTPTPTNSSTYSMSSGSTSEIISQTKTTQTATTRSLPALELGEYDLGGYSFHDYNGMGSLEENEPIVDDIEVVAKSANNTFTTKPDNGGFIFRDLPIAPYTVTEVHPENKFRYMWRSGEEVVNTKTGFKIDFRGKLRLDIAMGEGLLTSPYDVRNTFVSEKIYMDEDPAKNTYKDWRGDPDPCGGCADGHEGTDFFFPVGTPVYAAAPGKVKYIDNWGPVGLFLIIQHEDSLSTLSAHMSEVDVSKNQSIYRRQYLGKSGQDKTKRGAIQLHFELDQGFHGSLTRDSWYRPLDPYKSLWLPNALGYWTEENKLHFPN